MFPPLTPDEGDVAPMTALASALISRGHRVRLATHLAFRPLVTASDARIDFFPLHGDPTELVAFMRSCFAESPLRLAARMIEEVPRYASMMRRIFESCWDAFTAPLSPPGSFHSLISNPATYAHIHIAERTGLPLHIFFSQPWVKTKAFPHPLAGYVGEPCWSVQNLLTYDLIESSIFAGLRREVNYFRTEVLGLDPLSAFSQGWDLLNICKVPFTGLYSPTLMPKPKDWPSHCSVAGACVLLERASEKFVELFDRLPALSELPLIYVGFGSMMLTFEELKILLQWIDYAVSSMSARILLQITDEKLMGEISSLRSSISCPYFVANDLRELNMMEPTDKIIVITCILSHEALFQRCSGIVHHGGSGTTHRSLAAGKPTMIVPFFADQFSLGKMVQRLGCGPEPLPLYKHSTVTFATGISLLLSSACRESSLALSRQLKNEDGVDAAIAAWEQHLPIRKMVCAAALIDGVQVPIGRRACPTGCFRGCVVHQSLTQKSQKSGSAVAYLDWKALRQSNYHSEAVITSSSIAIELALDASLALYSPTKRIVSCFAIPFLGNIPHSILHPVSILRYLAQIVGKNYLPYPGFPENGPAGVSCDESNGTPISSSSSASVHDDFEANDSTLSSQEFLAPSLCQFLIDEYTPVNDVSRTSQNITKAHLLDEDDKTLELLRYLDSYCEGNYDLAQKEVAALFKKVCAECSVPESRWGEYYDIMMRSRCSDDPSFGILDIVASLYY